MKKQIAALLFFIPLSANVFAEDYRLYFPDIKLNPDEQIESFQVKVPCGHIHSIVGIPDDWNVEVIRRISGVEELHASAGHGASYKRDMKFADAVIHIISLEKACFSVEADITATFDEDRIIHLYRRDLKLLK
jgi:hypothetical protein